MQNCVAPASRVRVRGGEHLFEVEERVHVDGGVEAHRLRAERAVLRARTRLGVDEAFELDDRAHVREPHPVRERHERWQLVERERGDGVDLGARQRAPVFEQSTFGGDERHQTSGSRNRGIVNRSGRRDEPVGAAS